MEFRTQLKQLEDHYNSRCCASSDDDDSCYYRVEQSSDNSNNKGTCMIAANDIKNGEVILIEEPIGRLPAGPSPSVMQSAEGEQIWNTLMEFGRTHGHLTGPDRYPPQARQAMDRLTELNAREFLLKSPNLKEIWKLQDVHRESCKKRRGDIVLIDGLQSEAGKKLNGKQGRVLGIDEKTKDGDNRLAVEITNSSSKTKDSTTKEKKSIKSCNLKTLGGIVRTNGFADNQGTTTLLFQLVSRINHACGKYANVLKINDENDKGFLIAKKNIRKGEELLIDYIPGENDEDRLGLLELKYNFRCDCPAHI